MPVSKRTRYEVLRRDDFTCRYCGGKAPDVKLTVDHVTPVALGGSDDPSNLVTACQDCNFGKASTSPDSVIVADVDDAQVKWIAAVQAAQVEMSKRQRNKDATFDHFIESWHAYDSEAHHLPANAKEKLEVWLASGLTIDMIRECVAIAWAAYWVPPRNVFAYLCGVITNKTDELHAIAREIAEANG